MGMGMNVAARLPRRRGEHDGLQALDMPSSSLTDVCVYVCVCVRACAQM